MNEWGYMSSRIFIYFINLHICERANFLVYIHLVYSWFLAGKSLRPFGSRERDLFHVFVLFACQWTHRRVNHHLLGIQLKTFQIGSDSISRFALFAFCKCGLVHECIETARRPFSTMVENVYVLVHCVYEYEYARLHNAGTWCAHRWNKKYEYMFLCFFSHENGLLLFQHEMCELWQRAPENSSEMCSRKMSSSSNNGNGSTDPMTPVPSASITCEGTLRKYGNDSDEVAIELHALLRPTHESGSIDSTTCFWLQAMQAIAWTK